MYWLIGVGFLVLYALVTYTVGQYGSHCDLPNEQVGLCMPVRSCKSISEVFLNTYDADSQIAEELGKTYSQRFCGIYNNVHHVCCAESDIQLNPAGLEILKNQSCGSISGNKVSNGFEAVLFGYPWMAILVYNDSFNPYKCAGSIISDQYVLTSAHCIVDKKDLLHVRLGEHNLSSEIDCSGTICADPVENIGIEETIVHEGYITMSNDIALIRLSRRVQYQKHIQPLCLPIYDYLRGLILNNYIISGWGRTDKELYAKVLMVAAVPHVPRSQCQTILNSTKHRLRSALTETVFCAGNTQYVDVCDGDSGGPIGYKAFYGGHPRFVQFGVVSFGVSYCGEGNAPNAYANVSHYMQWITDHIKR